MIEQHPAMSVGALIKDRASAVLLWTPSVIPKRSPTPAGWAFRACRLRQARIELSDQYRQAVEAVAATGGGGIRWSRRGARRRR